MNGLQHPGSTPIVSAPIGPLEAMGDLAAMVFAGVLGPAVLSTGGPVQIGLADDDDVDRIREFYLALGDTSTYYRFFGIRRALPENELRGAVVQRLPDHITLLATIGDRLIGIGEYVPTDDGDERCVEVAFSVADDHHHEGVATLLLERLAIIAHRCGLERFRALVLPGNADMQLVFATVGLPETHRFSAEDGVVHVTMDLAGIDRMSEHTAQRHLHDGDEQGRPGTG